MQIDTEEAKFLLQKCSYLYRKHYDNVYLVTNSATQHALKNENFCFTKILNILDEVPIESIQKAYAIVKLYTIKYFTEREEHAFLSDFDFFIFEPFKTRILQADIFAQSLEVAVHTTYKTDKFVLECKNKYLAKNASILEHNNGINCGIIGGKNFSFLYEYATTAIQMIEDEENSSFWNKQKNDTRRPLLPGHRGPAQPRTHVNSLQAEQYYLYIALLEKKINFELAYQNSSPESRFYNRNYSFESLLNECSRLPYHQRDHSLFLHTCGGDGKRKLRYIKRYFPDDKPFTGLSAKMSSELRKLDFFK